MMKKLLYIIPLFVLIQLSLNHSLRAQEKFLKSKTVISEPVTEETLEILRYIKSKYEDHHTKHDLKIAEGLGGVNYLVRHGAPSFQSRVGNYIQDTVDLAERQRCLGKAAAWRRQPERVNGRERIRTIHKGGDLGRVKRPDGETAA